MREVGTKATYLGGHPQAVTPTNGRLTVTSGELRWEPETIKLRLTRADGVRQFAIDVAAIRSAEYRGDVDLKKHQSGFIRILPGVAHSYGGGQARHPLYPLGKIKKMLIVRYDDGGAERELVFVNHPKARRGALGSTTYDAAGYELANVIRAAASADDVEEDASERGSGEVDASDERCVESSWLLGRCTLPAGHSGSHAYVS
jgi:hypothetical protein